MTERAELTMYGYEDLMTPNTRQGTLSLAKSSPRNFTARQRCAGFLLFVRKDVIL
jgi:hypothetical protein